MYYILNEKREPVGPYSIEMLKELLSTGACKKEDLVCSEGDKSWVPLGTVIPTTPAEAEKPPEKVASQLPGVLYSRRAAAVIGDFRSMDFKSEVLPIDDCVFGRMKADFVFWSFLVMGAFPLLLATLSGSVLQLTGFSIFFAFIWGVAFKKFVINDSGGWKLPVGALFLTGMVGIPLLLLVYSILPAWYIGLPNGNILESLIGFIFQTGLCEEGLKILPVLAYLLWKRRQASPTMILLIGIFSGLGFAAFENLQYQGKAIRQTFELTSQAGAQGLQEGVRGAIVSTMLRSMSCVFGHAVYTGIFSYFIALGFVTKKRVVPLFLVGWGVAATVHGLYDWVNGIQDTLPAIITTGGFILFYAYLTKLRIVMSQTLPPPPQESRDEQANNAAEAAPLANTGEVA